MTYTKGLLGIDQRNVVADSLKQASARTRRLDRAASKPKSFTARSRPIPRLMEIVRQTGRTLFGDNCAACHGPNAQGRPGLPEPDDGVVAVGRRSRKHRRDHPRRHQFRASADQDLADAGVRARSACSSSDEIDNVVAYVRSLSDPAVAKQVPAAKIEAGKAVFAANCATCHGDDAKGKTDLGAPDLTDRVLDLRRRCRVDLHDGVGRPARPHAKLGGQTFAARPQDSRALSVRSPRRRTMSDDRRSDWQIRTKAVVWAAIGAGLLLLLIANAHLVYMAVVSQPDCVAHVRQGEGAAKDGKFSAARSSCTPR